MIYCRLKTKINHGKMYAVQNSAEKYECEEKKFCEPGKSLRVKLVNS